MQALITCTTAKISSLQAPQDIAFVPSKEAQRHSGRMETVQREAGRGRFLVALLRALSTSAA